MRPPQKRSVVRQRIREASSFMSIIDLGPTIREAARRHLGSLGLKQKGRSRFWYDDQRWYLIGVEFQPGRGKGTYLNVGCCWLWRPKPHFSYDLGSRERSFETFTTPAASAGLIDDIANQAAERVTHYRSLIASPASLAEYFRAHPPHVFWAKYHAGVAAALAGCAEEACGYFSQAASEDGHGSPDWLRTAAEDARQLLDLTRTPAAFYAHVVMQIRASRSIMKLPSVTDPLS
jgi:hypothetical protein